MKLNCSIKILNRLLPSLSMNSSTKYKYAVIYIKKQNKDFFVVVVTQNNKAGCRYKVNGNIEKTFGQFSEEGKCTIRFKEPCHDLLITAETASLKNFMLYIKKAWKGEINETDPVCKAVTNNIQCPSKLYKLKIEKREDYPTLKGFPKTLQFLSIENCKLIKFDSRLLELKSLTTLSLSKNKLTSIPGKNLAL
ncbi:UNVERIFIED_CONTAM: hypothetical protein PYX00_008426 [Menopon gallinae]|uniref:PIF1/LRR1 pleckstrin homology domain-containing protein n=1 Tax=Menopon gallinae TaxID=328185 RepID=A0AAW2HP99_9NEOP